MLRNTQFPLGKDGPAKVAQVAAVRDALLAEAGVHRDLLPESIRQEMLASGPVKELAERGEAWGRKLTEEPASAAPQPRPSGFGRKGVLLNGKPIDPAATYRVTTNSFLANGGDSFSLFTRQREAVTGGSDLEALEAWLKAIPARQVPSEVRASPAG